ncbi:ADP-ribosyltransferase [Vibrio cholerae]|uniref:ADP-ribosyltransferase n=1 Tax=Vibrio cholerae TaxID=666 RepID=UPI0029F1FFC3|nr:hypothetical protein [Vibrio cholerae]
MSIRLFNVKHKIACLSWLLLSFFGFSFHAYGAYFEGFTSIPRTYKVQKSIAKKFNHDSIKAYNISAQKLTSDETNAIKEYTKLDGTYKLFNEYYRDKTFNDKYGGTFIGKKRLSEILKGQIETLRSGMNKLPRYNGKVYRGTKLQANLVAELNVGDVVYEPGFMSTSILPEVAEAFLKIKNIDGGFTKVKFEIDLTQGGNVLSTWASNYDDEAEVLVQPKTYMRVKAIASQGDTKLIALENVTSLREEQYAYNLYSAEREPIGVAFEPSALHVACAL